MNNRIFVPRLLALILCGSGALGSSATLAQEAAKASAPAEKAVLAPAPPELIGQGQSLFFGDKRFSAGGPACSACHNLDNDAVIAGGTLAKDLTKVFDRLGAEGIIAMLPRKDGESPFPVMQVAFQGREITAGESAALVAFLQHASAQRATQKTDDFPLKMLLTGIAGVIILLLFFALIGRRRKRRCVNQEIYDRQITTG